MLGFGYILGTPRETVLHSSPIQKAALPSALSLALYFGSPPGLILGVSSTRSSCHGAQIESVQEGALDVQVEVEEEAHAPSPKKAPQDEAALQVIELCIVLWHAWRPSW
jgi:hypothetical protein